MKNITKLLVFTPFIVASALGNINCSHVKNWAGKTMQKLEQEESNNLKQYMIGTEKIQVGIGRGYAKYISEDIKKNPKLNEMIQNRKIDFHSINALYKEINKGNPVGAGIYQRPIWNFKNSN